MLVFMAGAVTLLVMLAVVFTSTAPASAAIPAAVVVDPTAPPIVAGGTASDRPIPAPAASPTPGGSADVAIPPWTIPAIAGPTADQPDLGRLLGHLPAAPSAAPSGSVAALSQGATPELPSPVRAATPAGTLPTPTPSDAASADPAAQSPEAATPASAPTPGGD